MDIHPRETFDRYLNLIGVARSRPSWEGLTELTSAHLRRIPFENVSKIYRARIRGIREIPRLDDFLDGVERYNFGGTCYTNNYYLHLLLAHLGYEARLCAADISVNGAPPNGHMVNVVTINESEAIADVGYGAPFWQPLPRDGTDDLERRLGHERYVLKPQDSKGRSRLELYRDNQLAHGYVLKPDGKDVRDFADVVARSYGDQAPFLNRLLLVRFFDDWALVLRNNSLTEMRDSTSISKSLQTLDSIANVIVDRFGIPAKFASAVLESLGDKVKFEG